MRNAFSQALIEAARADERVVLLTGDHGYALFDDFRKVCPGQYLNAGVAEQNMVGVAAGLAGTMLSAYLQNPWVLGAFALLFVLLSMSMFGMYELQLPLAARNLLVGIERRVPGGRAAGAFAMGVLSALIVGPCVAAPPRPSRSRAPWPATSRCPSGSVSCWKAARPRTPRPHRPSPDRIRRPT